MLWTHMMLKRSQKDGVLVVFFGCFDVASRLSTSSGVFFLSFEVFISLRELFFQVFSLLCKLSFFGSLHSFTPPFTRSRFPDPFLVEQKISPRRPADNEGHRFGRAAAFGRAFHGWFRMTWFLCRGGFRIVVVAVVLSSTYMWWCTICLMQILVFLFFSKCVLSCGRKWNIAIAVSAF